MCLKSGYKVGVCLDEVIFVSVQVCCVCIRVRVCVSVRVCQAQR